MNRQPRGDRWRDVLAHRPEHQREATTERFRAAGISVELVQSALADGGDALHAAASSGGDDRFHGFGGNLGAALLAAEVSTLAAHLVSRASAVRAIAVEFLLDDYSAVAVATALGVSRQKVYDIGKGGSTTPFIETVPWSES
ncbi:hypothetical protein EYE40_01200 [Glaciihabitans arcticus]|uniref:Uncharacterized protein n=1 Tax=Glaciihabitans arcticus TaxID=2668039 RepID=A0A4Q9GN56_9MICO|nr:hypothetical protein [Glaciihabitans arcticus]TBN56121.1 hypothetical protein EYE40_01200 [Glaciihabitans arcticus]